MTNTAFRRKCRLSIWTCLFNSSNSSFSFLLFSSKFQLLNPKSLFNFYLFQSIASYTTTLNHPCFLATRLLKHALGPLIHPQRSSRAHIKRRVLLRSAAMGLPLERPPFPTLCMVDKIRCRGRKKVSVSYFRIHSTLLFSDRHTHTHTHTHLLKAGRRRNN